MRDSYPADKRDKTPSGSKRVIEFAPWFAVRSTSPEISDERKRKRSDRPARQLQCPVNRATVELLTPKDDRDSKRRSKPECPGSPPMRTPPRLFRLELAGAVHADVQHIQPLLPIEWGLRSARRLDAGTCPRHRSRRSVGIQPDGASSSSSPSRLRSGGPTSPRAPRPNRMWSGDARTRTVSRSLQRPGSERKRGPGPLEPRLGRRAPPTRKLPPGHFPRRRLLAIARTNSA
jgi:hypothetical protein